MENSGEKINNDNNASYGNSLDKKEIIKFEYNNNIKYENEYYELKLPDSFEILQNNNRDFMARCKSLNDKNGEIKIMAGVDSPKNGFGLKSSTEVTRLLAIDFLYWNDMYQKMRLIFGKHEYESINENGFKSKFYHYKDNTAADNFYFYCILKNTNKMFRIEMVNIDGTYEELKDLAINLMKNFKCKQTISEDFPLNSNHFMQDEINEDLIEEAIETVKIIDENIHADYVVITSIAQKKIDLLMNTGGQYSIENLKDDVKENINFVFSYFEQKLKEIYEFVERLKSSNVNNDILIKFYCSIKKLIEKHKKYTLGMGKGMEYTEELDYATEVYNKIFTADIENMIKDSSFNDMDIQDSDNNDNLDDEDDEWDDEEDDEDDEWDNEEDELDDEDDEWGDEEDELDDEDDEWDDEENELDDEDEEWDDEDEDDDYGIFDKCEILVKKYQKQIDNIRKDWDKYMYEFRNEISGRIINSQAELDLYLYKLKDNITKYGHMISKCISKLDIEARVLLRQGAGLSFIFDINDIIDEAFSAIEELSTDCTTSGTMNSDLGNLSYTPSSDIEYIKTWWKNKRYET